MKKIILFVAAALMFISSRAQQRPESVVFNTVPTKGHNTKVHVGDPRNSARTTSGVGGSRWYDYVNDIFGHKPGITLADNIIDLWNDTAAIQGYGTGGDSNYYQNVFNSYGLELDPFLPEWNDSTVFPGALAISDSDSYTIDSVMVYGQYFRSPMGGSYADTLTLALIYGNGVDTDTTNLQTYYFNDGGSTANYPYPQYGVDTLYYVEMRWDMLHNHADSITGGPGASLSVQPMYASDTATNFAKLFPLTPLTIPPGNFAAISVSFKSGDPTFTPFDTVRYSDGTYKHGGFRTHVAYNIVGTVAGYAAYDTTDWTTGYFASLKYLGWENYYTPNWAWENSSLDGSTLEYPHIAYHATCSTCRTMGQPSTTNTSTAKTQGITTNAYPNPANNELTISFDLPNIGSVSISLTDITGQVVASQQLQNTQNGKATFITSLLSSGIYLYTVNADKMHSLGRFVLNH